MPGLPHSSSAARAAAEDARRSARHSWSRLAVSRGKVLLTVLSWMGDLRGGSPTSARAWSWIRFRSFVSWAHLGSRVQRCTAESPAVSS